jgi:CheY-like chemotaxis protein
LNPVWGMGLLFISLYNITDVAYKINCAMLVDDNPDDNFFHERVIKKSGFVKTVVTKQSALAALEYLKLKNDHINEHPDLIFLDINMPGMNGWEFLTEYDKLDKKQQCKIIICMLTTSENPGDRAKLKVHTIVSEFISKPLNLEMLKEIVNKYFT